MKKIMRAFFHSLNGLRECFKKEHSFRIEICLFFLLSLLTFFLIPSHKNQFPVFLCFFIVLICELFNSAIEKLSDRITDENDPLIKYAKDVASAAVFLSILMTVLTFGCALLMPSQ
jgi:diacylglycerol kinase (ATP)